MTEKVKKTRRRLVYRVPDHRPTDDPERIKAMERRMNRRTRILSGPDSYAKGRLLELENAPKLSPSQAKLAKLVPIANQCKECGMPYEHFNHAIGMNEDAHLFSRKAEWKQAEQLKTEYAA